MATIQQAVAAANGRLSPVQANLLERLNSLTEEAEGMIGLPKDHPINNHM